MPMSQEKIRCKFKFLVLANKKNCIFELSVTVQKSEETLRSKLKINLFKAKKKIYAVNPKFVNVD